ncbi:hypothetical protein QR685DRAFT_534189 [Neurospora intermedia]|uniref:Secreted protein n=1 Tax=Neurospora intermedia TaxID=5142 RepID=A0ABR3D4Y2_NEUIN
MRTTMFLLLIYSLLICMASSFSLCMVFGPPLSFCISPNSSPAPLIRVAFRLHSSLKELTEVRPNLPRLPWPIVCTGPFVRSFVRSICHPTRSPSGPSARFLTVEMH